MMKHDVARKSLYDFRLSDFSTRVYLCFYLNRDYGLNFVGYVKYEIHYTKRDFIAITVTKSMRNFKFCTCISYLYHLLLYSVNFLFIYCLAELLVQTVLKYSV